VCDVVGTQLASRMFWTRTETGSGCHTEDLITAKRSLAASAFYPNRPAPAAPPPHAALLGFAPSSPSLGSIPASLQSPCPGHRHVTLNLGCSLPETSREGGKFGVLLFAAVAVSGGAGVSRLQRPSGAGKLRLISHAGSPARLCRPGTHVQ